MHTKINRSISTAYITSMKKGLPSFVTREIDEINKTDNSIFIYSTKYATGLYMPQNPVYRMNPFFIILKQAFYFIFYIRNYFLLFALALKTNSLVDFFIACDFAYDMKKKGVNSIHCIEGLRSLNIGFFCRKLLGIPLTVTIYADGLYISPNETLFKYALDECEKVITICEYNKKILLQKYSLSEEKVELIPIGLDTSKIKPEKLFNILIVAQFAARKGHRVLFEAVKQIARDDIRIWVVGNKGTDKTFVDVPKLSADIGIENKVIFWGNLPESALFFLYQACDVFCLPSINAEVPEGTPVALMEAMAFEKPVISTRHAGIPEYVKEVLINQNNVDELIKAILFFIENPTEKIRQGVENRKIIESKFPVSNINDLNNVFREVSNGNLER